MAQDREQYKERMRAAGRRALEDFRRNKGERTALGTALGSGPRQPPALELATFRVYTRPAAVETGLTRPPESSELRLMAPALASTSLGSLPPGSAYFAPPPRPPSSGPSSTASTIGSTSVGSLGSTATGFSAGPFCTVAGSSAGHSPPASHMTAAVEDEDVRLLGLSPSRCGSGGGGGGGGGGDQAMVDMLLGQVEALMRDKASQAAENVALRQQVEQLTELVGWLSLERGDAEGQEAGEGGEEAGPGGEAEAAGMGEGSRSSFDLWPVGAAAGCGDRDGFAGGGAVEGHGGSEADMAGVRGTEALGTVGRCSSGRLAADDASIRAEQQSSGEDFFAEGRRWRQEEGLPSGSGPDPLDVLPGHGSTATGQAVVGVSPAVEVEGGPLRPSGSRGAGG